MFYLANSYRDCGRLDAKKDAISWYKKRIEQKGWDEEVWNAYYHIGNCHNALNEHEHAIYYWLEAYNHRPTRAESIYKIVNHYRTYSKHNLALRFCLIGKTIKFPKDDLLFIEKPVYEYLFDYELSIIAYYTKFPINHTMMTNLLAIGYNYDNVMSNYSFYINTLSDISGCVIRCFNDSKEVVVKDKLNKFVSSTPCIVPYKKKSSDCDKNIKYVMNLRYVNYKVGSKGEYTLENNDGIVITLNERLFLDKDLKVIGNKGRGKQMFEIGDTSNSYIGFEDVRMTYVGDKCVYQGMAKDDKKGFLQIGVGDYIIEDDDKKKLEMIVYDSPYGRRCEKNWALFEKNNELYAIYEYNPLTVIKFDRKVGSDNKKVEIVSKNDDIPAIFKQFRGSSCGVKVYNKKDGL
jgi:tetratricopeptide (TPR) repeat protein